MELVSVLALLAIVAFFAGGNRTTKIQEIEEPLAESLMAERLRFAERCFVNAQELIRFMDQKAGFLVAAVGILTAGVATLAKEVLFGPAFKGWAEVCRLVGVSLSFAYLLMAFLTLYYGVKVFSASPNRLNPATKAPGLLFPLILLARFEKDEVAYAKQLNASTEQSLIADYSNQILEISNIYASKHERVNKCMDFFRAASIIWVCAMFALFAATLMR